MRLTTTLLVAASCIVFLTSSAGAMATRCPPTLDDNAQDFVGVSDRHRKDLGKMMAYRGLLKDHYERFRPFNLGDVVNQVRALESKAGVSSGQLGLLFYQYAERRVRTLSLGQETWSETVHPMLRNFLVTAEGLVAYECLEVSRDELAQKQASLRTALRVDALQAARMPMRRDGTTSVASIPPLRATSSVSGTDELTELLLPPSIARSIGPLRRLIVVPALGIATVPFALLKPFGTAETLIDRATVAIAPSLYDLGDAGRPWPAGYRARSALVVGNPHFDDSEWVFPPLPGAEREAKFAAQAFGVRPLLGGHASKERVVSQAREADVLYLASHALADAADPLKGSFIALAGTVGGDSRWSALEVQRTRFRARLAILSACQTGLGQVHDAGVIGLARGFQISGVPRVVVSLWSVDDAATAQLMETFVRELSARPPAEALRKAMLATRNNFPEPFQWASFTMFGTLW